MAEPREREKALCSPQHQSLHCSFPMPRACTHTHTLIQCTSGESARSHLTLCPCVLLTAQTCASLKPPCLCPLPFPTSLSGARARWHVHAPTSADSSAGCGECASPRGPYLSYATLCKSAAITGQQEQRWWR